MTPQERELIAELFDKLASLEKNPRDPEAEKAIVEGVRRAPHALYPLVQTVLVQDEALKVANQRISELQNAAAQPQQSSGFLGGLFGGHSSGSVPSVRSAAPAQYAQPSQPYQQPAPQQSSGSGFGGSFLGTAAAAAAGLVGGSLLLGGIRSLFGGGYGGHGPFAGTFDTIGGWGGPAGGEIINDGGPGGAPWGTAGGDYGGGGDYAGGGGDYASGGDYGGGGDIGGGGFDSASNDSGGGFDSSDSGGAGSDYA
jgi:hypothetical protein